jgi:MerR family transcriptional regulator/heat shock protein HspR
MTDPVLLTVERCPSSSRSARDEPWVRWLHIPRKLTMDDRPRYTISVAAGLVGMHPQTLRIYEAKGLVRPGRTPGGTRLYSETNLERLKNIQRLTTELGLNLAGVQRVLVLEDEMGKLRARVARLERELRDEVASVHKQYKRELVLWSEMNQPQRRTWISRR